MEDWMWVIQLVSALGVATAAFFAWRSARASQQSADETRKAVQAEIIMRITGAYSSPEMLSGMQALRNWKERHGAQFAEKFGEMRQNDDEYKKIKELDEARRSFSHHFHSIKLLFDTGVVNKDLVKELAKPNQVEFLLEVIEPLEAAIDAGYDRSTFDFFRGL